MPYSKQPWADGVAGGTPIDAEALTHIEDGLYAAHVAVDAATAAIENTNDALATTNGSVVDANAAIAAAVSSIGDTNDELTATNAALAAANAEIDALTLALAEATTRDRVLAYASNRTGVATAATVSPATPAAIPGCIIDVPPSNGKQVKIKWGALWGITTAGAGRLVLPVYELTNGGATLIATPYMLTTAASPAAGSYGGWQETPWYDIGIVTTPRKFGLYAQLVRDAGSNLAAYIHNVDVVGGYPFITAEEK